MTRIVQGIKVADYNRRFGTPLFTRVWSSVSIMERITCLKVYPITPLTDYTLTAIF